MKQQQDTFKLSICMMVKDEEKNIKRCLDALKELLKKTDVELIIVDTGSSDQTPFIAGMYTNKLFFHPWANNFSDMRNVTISYATGEYILILDADEVMLNPLMLYELINDKRLDKFNTYIVKIKNLNVYGRYTVLLQERVFRNDGDFHYEGAVHNQPKFKAPLLNTEICLEHYGYLFNDNDLKEKKFKRTGGILKKELEKKPDNPYYRYQLARSYLAHDDKVEALEEIRRAYGLIKGNEKKIKMYAYIYGSYAMICFANNEYAEAARVSCEGIKYRNDYVDLYFTLGFAKAFLGEKEEALSAYIKYLELAEKYNDLDISQSRSLEMYYMDKAYMDKAAAFIANVYYNEGRYDESFIYTKRINDDKKRYQLIIKLHFKQKNFRDLKYLYVQTINDKKIKDMIVSIIEAEMDSCSDADRKEIRQLFSVDEDLYSILNRVRCNALDDKWKKLNDILRNVDLNNLPSFYADLFIDIDINTRRVISILKKLQKYKIKEYIKRLSERNERLKTFFEEYLLSEYVRNDDYNGIRVYLCIANHQLMNEAAIIKNVNGEVSDKHFSIFRRYVEAGINYVNLLYNTERLRLNYTLFDEKEDCFFVALQYANEAINKGDIVAALKYFRAAMRANPYLICYMKRLKDDLFANKTTPEMEEILDEQY